MVLLFGGILDQVLDDAIEVDRAKRRLLNYHWREDTLFFKNLVVPKPRRDRCWSRTYMRRLDISVKEGHWLRLRRIFFGMT
jgi:hypothetical protein